MYQSMPSQRQYALEAHRRSPSSGRGLVRACHSLLSGLAAFLFISFLASRPAAAQDPASELALTSQQEGLDDVKQGLFEQALGAFSRAYYQSRGNENLLAMAYCEDRLKRFGSASLLLRQLRGLMTKEELADLRIGDIVFPAGDLETVDELHMGKVPVNLVLDKKFLIENAQIFVDGQPLIIANSSSPTDVVLTPLPTELAYLAWLNKSVDLAGQQRKGSARLPKGSLELADKAFLATLVPPPLQSSSFTLLLDPGQHIVQLRDKNQGFAAYNVPNGLNVRDGNHNPVLTVDPNNRYATLAVNLPGEQEFNAKKAATDQKSEKAQSAASAGLNNKNDEAPPAPPRLAAGQPGRVILIEVRNLKGKPVAEPRRVSSAVSQLNIEVPPNAPKGSRYSLFATVSGGDFLPFRQDDLQLISGELKEINVRFNVRPLYKKWAFWTSLAVGVALIGGAVGGGITGYNTAHTYNGGTSNWVVRQSQNE